MSNCHVVTFPLVSWVRCGALLYRFSDLCPLSYFYNLILDLVLKISTLMKFVRHSTSLTVFHDSHSSILILQHEETPVLRAGDTTIGIDM